MFWLAKLASSREKLILWVKTYKEIRLIFHCTFDAMAENFQVVQIPMELGESFCALLVPSR